MKYLDLFSGAGGFRSAFEQIPGTECVGHCEIDVHADKSYRALFHTEGEWFCNDARQIDTAGLPDFDLVCGGFPCQSFSIAGHRKGFEDTRGTLFFEIARILKARKPPLFCLKTYPDCYRMTKGGPSPSSSGRFLGWGIMSNGKCLTARILASPNHGSACSLSGILERDVPAKYYLSSAQMERLLYKSSEARKARASTTQKE